MRQRITIALLSLLLFVPAMAQKEEYNALKQATLMGLEYRVKAGFNIGGTSPLPLPREIRAINSYSPTLAIAIEGDVHKQFENSRWGFLMGLRFETKGMKTNARVKNYHMEMTAKDGGYIEGAWTGCVKTKVRMSYVTIPMLATYKATPRLELHAGPYFSYATDREFSGSAIDGYIREGDATGEKAYVEEATYDFSDDIRNFQWGVQLGCEWRAYKHLNLYADLSWGINSMFPNHFESVTFSMYPIYANLGFAYVF